MDYSIRRKLLKNRQGMAGLVELVLVCGGMVVTAGALLMVVSAGQRSWFTSDAALLAQDRLRMALEATSESLRRSGNEAAATHITINHSGVNCPSIVYRVPLVIYDGNPGWGITNPGAASIIGGAEWIYLSQTQGGGASCTGSFLVRELFSTWIPGSDPTSPIAGSRRILASGVTAFSPKALGSNDADIPWTGDSAAWRTSVQQVEARLKVEVPAALGPKVALEQLVRIQLRNSKE